MHVWMHHLRICGVRAGSRVLFCPPKTYRRPAASAKPMPHRPAGGDPPGVRAVHWRRRGSKRCRSLRAAAGRGPKRRAVTARFRARVEHGSALMGAAGLGTGCTLGQACVHTYSTHCGPCRAAAPPRASNYSTYPITFHQTPDANPFFPFKNDEWKPVSSAKHRKESRDEL